MIDRCEEVTELSMVYSAVTLCFSTHVTLDCIISRAVCLSLILLRVVVGHPCSHYKHEWRESVSVNTNCYNTFV